MIEMYFDNNEALAAESAGVSLQFLRNWLTERRKVMRLADGNFVLDVRTKKIISCPQREFEEYDENMRLSVRKIVETYFNNYRVQAAAAAGVTLAFMNNWISQDRTAKRLEGGSFILETRVQQVFRFQCEHDYRLHRG